jgi:hypothetical protein
MPRMRGGSYILSYVDTGMTMYSSGLPMSGLGLLPIVPTTVYSAGPIRTRLPTGSMAGKSV